MVLREQLTGIYIHQKYQQKEHINIQITSLIQLFKE